MLHIKILNDLQFIVLRIKRLPAILKITIYFNNKIRNLRNSNPRFVFITFKNCI